MANLSTIKNWFKTGLRPTEQQFSDTWDSFFHKNDKVPIAQVEGIDAVFTAINAATQAVANAKIVAVGQITVYKHPQNSLLANNNVLEVNDVASGFFADGTFMPFGMYLGGDLTDANSWNTSLLFTP